MNKIAVSVAIAFAVMMMPMAAAQSSNSGSSPGMVGADSPLYGLETAWDNAAVGIGLKKASTVAKERAAEAEAMAEKNNTKGMQKAAEQFGMMAERAMQNNETAGLTQSIQKMEQLAQNAPNEEARQGMNTALQNMKEARSKKTRQRDNPSEGSVEIPENRTGEPETPMPKVDPRENQENSSNTPDGQTDEESRENVQERENSDTVRTSGTGKFNLLVSDRPADISSFDYLNVTFERVRVFSSSTNSDEETENETSENETETDMNTTENSTEEMENETDSEGFREITINGSTVDLTGVVGEYAKSIVNTELEAGTYNKIELYSSEIEASVNGSNVNVKIPPGKLMITKPFNVSENSTTEFVFDIQVVLRGNQNNNQGYILKPVISQSGVAGKDVEMIRGPSNSTEDMEGNQTQGSDGGEQGGKPEYAGQP